MARTPASQQKVSPPTPIREPVSEADSQRRAPKRTVDGKMLRLNANREIQTVVTRLSYLEATDA